MFLAFTCWPKLRKTFSFGKLYFCFALLRLSGVYSSTENLRWAHQFLQSCQNPEDRGQCLFGVRLLFFLTFLLFLARTKDRELLAYCVRPQILEICPSLEVRVFLLNWKQSKVRSPNFWLQNELCSIKRKKGDRRKETGSGSALPRFHGIVTRLI